MTLESERARQQRFERLARKAAAWKRSQRGQPAGTVQPTKRTKEPDTSKLKRALAAEQRKRKETTTPAGPSISPRKETLYLHLDGRVLDRAGVWHKRDERWWDSLQRRGGVDRVLQVGDPGGSTTMEVGSNTVIRRGCLIDGAREIVHDQVSIGKWESGPWRGGLCVVCHRQWVDMSISDKRSFEGVGFWVTSRLAGLFARSEVRA